jgi:hypothetical protein
MIMGRIDNSIAKPLIDRWDSAAGKIDANNAVYFFAFKKSELLGLFNSNTTDGIRFWFGIDEDNVVSLIARGVKKNTINNKTDYYDELSPVFQSDEIVVFHENRLSLKIKNFDVTPVEKLPLQIAYRWWKEFETNLKTPIAPLGKLRAVCFDNDSSKLKDYLDQPEFDLILLHIATKMRYEGVSDEEIDTHTLTLAGANKTISGYDIITIHTTEATNQNILEFGLTCPPNCGGG